MRKIDRSTILIGGGSALIAVAVLAGIKNPQISQFPAADLASRTIAINVKSVAETTSRDAITFVVPEPWIVTGIDSYARTLAGTITTFTMDVKRTAGSVTHSILRNAVDMYTADGLAGAGTRRQAVLASDIGNGYTVLNTGDVVTINYVMQGTDTPLATDVSWSMHYRSAVGLENQ